MPDSITPWQIDGRDFFQRGIEDVDDVRTLIHRPDLIAERDGGLRLLHLCGTDS